MAGLALAVSCGGVAESDWSPDAGDAGGGTGGTYSTGGSGGTGGTVYPTGGRAGTGGRDAGRDARDSGKDARDSGWVDPVCPDAPPPPPLEECDPFSTPTGCAAGQGCYPYVDYPTGPCDEEQYGTVCMTAGYGTQGSPCDGSACASGHVCVVTGSGNQCVELCDPTGPDTCPGGLICFGLDVAGFGGCL